MKNLIRLYTTRQGDISIEVDGQPRGAVAPSLAQNLRREVALVLERAGLLKDVALPQVTGDITFDVTLSGRVELFSNGTPTKTLDLGGEGGRDDSGAQTSAV